MDRLIDVWFHNLIFRPFLTIMTTFMVGVGVNYFLYLYLGWWVIVPAIITSLFTITSLAVLVGVSQAGLD